MGDEMEHGDPAAPDGACIHPEPRAFTRIDSPRTHHEWWVQVCRQCGAVRVVEVVVVPPEYEAVVVGNLPWRHEDDE